MAAESANAADQKAAAVPLPDDLPEIDLVLDTNIVIEMGGAELWAEASSLKESGEPKYESTDALAACPDFRSRELRAKYALVLGHVLSEREMSTFSSRAEVKTTFKKRMPPDVPMPATSLMYVWGRIQDSVFPGWRKHAPKGKDGSLKGDAMDAYLVRVAKARGVSLVTDEGLSPKKGVVEKTRNIRGRCNRAGVRCFAPSEYLAVLDVDIDATARRAYDAVRRALSDLRWSSETESGLAEDLQMMLATNAYVLLGKTDSAHATTPRPPVRWDGSRAEK